MSEAIAATASWIDDLPAYLGESMHGERVLGRDTDFLAQQLLRYRLPHGAFETVAMLAPEAKEFASFSRLTSALHQLRGSPESDEFGPLRPTAVSIDRATKALFPLVQRGFSFPEAVDVGTDHDGALRIVWENGARFLELVVPYESDAGAYFYYSSGNQYNLQRDFTLPALRERFNWLSGGG